MSGERLGSSRGGQPSGHVLGRRRLLAPRFAPLSLNPAQLWKRQPILVPVGELFALDVVERGEVDHDAVNDPGYVDSRDPIRTTPARDRQARARCLLWLSRASTIAGTTSAVPAIVTSEPPSSTDGSNTLELHDNATGRSAKVCADLVPGAPLMLDLAKANFGGRRLPVLVAAEAGGVTAER